MSKKLTGKDGQSVTIPDGYTGHEGEDGRVIAVPPGYSYHAGKTGRDVAIPPGFSHPAGKEGRVVATPPCRATGCICPYRPPTGMFSTPTFGYCPASWTRQPKR